MIKKSGLLRLIAIIFILRFLIEVVITLVSSLEFSWITILPKYCWTAGELLIIGLLLDLMVRVKPLRPVARIFLVFTTIFLILWTIINPIVLTLAGDNLTPSLLQHFVGSKLFLSDDLWLPIRRNWMKVLGGILTAVFLIILLSRYTNSKIKNHLPLPIKEFTTMLVVSLILMVVPVLIHGRFLQYPGEAIFVRNWMKWDIFQPDAKDLSTLRNFLQTSENQNEVYPLLQEIKGKPTSRPNIILFVIESLRAQEISTFYDEGQIEMKSFDQFAQHGILFKSFISNGYPSTEGFLSLAMGIWPHAKERLVLAKKDKTLPSLAKQLGVNGYKTYRIEDWTDRDEEGYFVRKTFDQQVNFFVKDHIPSEKNMVDTLMQIMRYHEESQEPYYIHLKTRNPHYPYQITNEKTNEFYQIGTPKENYYASMAVMDRNLSRLYAFMKENHLFDNNIIIITGDHSNILNKLHWSALPYNESVWTGAILAGDSSIIGHPRIELDHASQVDLSTTILNLTQGTKQWVGFGKNLLDENSSKYTVAVRPAGVRLDYQGYSFIVDRYNPHSYIANQAFPHTSNAQQPTPPVSSLELLNIVDSYTYLIESNCVYPE